MKLSSSPLKIRVKFVGEVYWWWMVEAAGMSVASLQRRLRKLT
jgi:hypothetical protein